jgi:CRP-like cAMP-binding protein
VPAPESNAASWSVLRGCRPLAGLSDDTLRDLFAAAEPRSFGVGDRMIRQGDAADGLLILLEGTAHAQLRSRDGDYRVGDFAGGDIVGEMALVTREPRSADVAADSAVHALFVPTAAFDQLATRHLSLGMVLTQLVGDRLGQGTRDGLGGKTVEAFRILQCIGRGGMSVVYRAEDEASGELVALKMMSYRLIYDTSALARFHQESRLLQRLDHVNVVRVTRSFPALRTYFLVMELCDGTDLRRAVASGRMREAQVRAILGQLACAIEYLHGQGVVHRDLKPANVMLTRDGQVKLMDFGIALPALDLEDTRTSLGDHGVVGTPSYMAPEQLSGGVLDARTDVYALGCLAYELLTGRQLFSANNIFDLVREKATLRVPPAASIGIGISQELYEFIAGALEVNPDNRPSSVAALAAWAAPCDMLPADVSGQEERPTEAAGTENARAGPK